MTVYDVVCRIMKETNNKLVYITDKEQYGVPEYWTPSLKGDCEDIAIYRYKMCEEAGLKPRLVLCLTEHNERHIVCEVDGWVLDNRHLVVMRRDDLPYTWISIGMIKGDWFWL